MTVSPRILAKIGGARVGRFEFMSSLSVRLTVRITTRAKRLVSGGPPGVIAVARASMMALLGSESENLLGTRRYFPAARTQLSEMEVYNSVSA